MSFLYDNFHKQTYLCLGDDDDDGDDAVTLLPCDDMCVYMWLKEM